MARIFVYDGREFPDPDPGMSVEQVKGTLADFYGEIAKRLGEGDQAGRRHGLRVPAAGGHQGRLHLCMEPGEVVRWTASPLPIC